MLTPDAGQNPLTRGLPKTGQVTQHAAGDDGTYEAGWWVGRLNANNRVRFILSTIGGDDIVIDRATGLMWARNGWAAGCNNGNLLDWAASIVYANGLTFATFSDWRIPNSLELVSICRYDLWNPSINPLFINTNSGPYWTSTTRPDAITNAYGINFWGATLGTWDKETTLRLRCVRKGV